nr:MAG TPA: hypothetical protein [Caudoviricetes sp.]
MDKAVPARLFISLIQFQNVFQLIIMYGMRGAAAIVSLKN